MNLLDSGFPPSLATQSLLYKKDYLAIYHNSKDAWIYADWMGHQTNHTIKEGSEKILELVQGKRIHKLINDNTHLTGIRANAIEWLALDLAPRLQKAGLQYIGWIYKTNSLGEVSADHVLSLSQTDIIVIVFDNVLTAEKWLRSVR